MGHRLLPREIALPPICACCLTPTTNLVTVTDIGKTIAYDARNRTRTVRYQVKEVPNCDACARRYANLGRIRAVVLILTLIAGVLILANSPYQHEHHPQLLAGFGITIAVAILLMFLVGQIPPYRKQGHVPRCRIGWIQRDGQLALVNGEYAQRALDEAEAKR